MVTIEDKVYQALKQMYSLAHALVTFLFKYLRQNYDALAEYARSNYISRLPEDSFTFRSRYHPELNRRLLVPEKAATTQPGQGGPADIAPPAAADLRRVLQYQIALFLAGGETAPNAARRAREALARALAGQAWPETSTGTPALAQLTRTLVRSPANVGWRALPGNAQLTLEDFLADSSFAEGAPLGLADQLEQFWKQALPNLDVNRNLMRDELKDPHPDWELRQQNFAEVMPLEHAAMVVGLPQEAHPAFGKSAGESGAAMLASLDPFALTVVRTLHGLMLSTESFPRLRYLTQVWARLDPADRARLVLPISAGYGAAP